MQQQTDYIPATMESQVVPKNREGEAAVAEVQAKLIVANRFPRDEETAYRKIISACKRYSLANGALYSYPRGGARVEGPSISLARAIAIRWGNLDFGTRAIEEDDDGTRMEAYCWDLETNVCERRQFYVPHSRKARGKINKLTDPRDVYELTANMGARRLRACILAVIPEDVVDAAVSQVNETLRTGPGKGGNFDDRKRKMVVAFDEVGVTKPMIEKHLGHKFDSISPAELARLGKIYRSIKDGIGRRRDFFEVEIDLSKKVGKSKKGGDKKPEKKEDDPIDDPENDVNAMSLQDIFDEYGGTVDKALKKIGKKFDDLDESDAGMLLDMCVGIVEEEEG